MTYDMSNESHADYDAREVRDAYGASVIVGTVALAVLVAIAMGAVVIVWAALTATNGAVRP